MKPCIFCKQNCLILHILYCLSNTFFRGWSYTASCGRDCTISPWYSRGKNSRSFPTPWCRRPLRRKNRFRRRKPENYSERSRELRSNWRNAKSNGRCFVQFKTGKNEGGGIPRHGFMRLSVSLKKSLLILLHLVFSDEPKQVEPLIPPNDAKAGDKIVVENFESGQPDDVLNPKKKVWEKLQVDLKVNGDGVAQWQGNNLLTLAGGKICSKSIPNAPIK